jgi:tetratricopeptide (TPR) repeat protein
MDAAGNLLEQAIKLDPDFGIAWSALATVNRVKVENGYLDAFEGTEQARRLTQHALQLSPSSAHAHASLSAIYLSYDWNWADAASEIQQALALDPTNSSVLLHAARLSMTLGRWEDAERQLRAALGRDPLSSYAIFNLGQTYYRSGRLAEAEATLGRLLEVSPDFPWTRGQLGAVLLEQGNAEAALSMVQQGTDEAMRLVALPIMLEAAGQRAAANEALQAQIAQWADTGAFYVAMTYAYRGDHDHAIEWLERAYTQRDPTLIELVGEPLFKRLYDDSRYKAFLRKMNLPESPPPATDLKKREPPS